MDKKILILVLILAAFLRFYRLDSLMGFIGEQGRDYLISAEIITNHKIPGLVKIYSVPNTSVGPFFYCFQAIALWIGNFNPVAPALMTSIMGLLSVILMYFIGRKLFNKFVGIYSAIFFAFSPLMVVFSRIPIHVNVFSFFLLVYTYLLIDFLKGKSKNLLILSILWLLVIQIHLSALLIFPLTIILWYLNRNKIHVKKSYLAAIALLFLPPVIIAGETIYALFGLGVKKTISLITLKNLYITPVPYYLEIFQKLFSMESLLIGILFLPFFLKGLQKIFKRKDFSSRILLVWFFIALAGLIIKNSTSEHYFNLIIPVFFMITAVGLDKFRSISILLLLLFALSNLIFLPKRDFYMDTINNSSKFNYGVPLPQRLEIARYIVAKSQGNPVSIKVIGDFDIYSSTVKNYEYLVFYLKGKIGPKDRVVIYEPKDFAKIHKEEGERREFTNAIVEYRHN